MRARIVLLTGLLLGSALPAHAQPNASLRLPQAEITPRIMQLVHNQYIDPERIDPQSMFDGALDELQKSVPEIMADTSGNGVIVTIDNATKKFPLKHSNRLPDIWSTLSKVFTFIDLHYHGETEASELEYLAIDGLLGSLDPHSSLLRPKIYEEFKVGTKGNFGGIGIVIGVRDGHLTVIAPIEGTPAARAGIKAQDQIIQIGEDSTVNMQLSDAVDHLRGKPGTAVVLTVRRQNRPPFPVTLKRAIIHIDSVHSTLLSAAGKDIGYLRVKNFQENTMSDFAKQLRELHRKARGEHIDGLILDLRNNPGGLLQQAIDMGDTFLTGGTIVSTVGAGGVFLDQSRARRRNTQPNYPMVVLVNAGSASASEIVAGALQAHKRAIVIGVPTFGKGSVQTVYNLPDGSALKLTIAEYLPAGTVSIQEVGLTPDIALQAMTVDKTYMNLLADKRYREKDLEKHLKRNHKKKGTARYTLRFSKEPEPESDLDAKTAKAYKNDLTLGDDFGAQIAKRLLVARSVASDRFWEQLDAPLATIQNEEDRKVQKSLKKIGVNWDQKAAKGKAKLAVSYILRHNKQRVTRVPAGEKSQMVLTVTNTGSAPFYRLIGQTESDLHILTNKEFIFGHLAPGQSHSWTVEFTPGKHVLTEDIPVKITWNAAQQAPAPYSAVVPIEGMQRPKFAFSYRLGSPRGGKVKPVKPLPIGKSIPLHVQVKNIGTGTAVKPIVSIKNETGTRGPYIEIGRVTLDSIAPGKTASAELRFHVDPSFKQSHFTMNVGIIDSELFESIVEKVNFAVETGRTAPPAGAWYESPDLHITSGHNITWSKGKTMSIKGSVTDDTEVKDVFIYVGDKKIMYESNPKQLPRLEFQRTVELEEGFNVVTIAARDNNNLLSQQRFTVYRPKNEDKPYHWPTAAAKKTDTTKKP